MNQKVMCAFLAFIPAVFFTSCKPAVQRPDPEPTATVYLYTADFQGNEMLAQTDISVIRTGASCTYRLEYDVIEEPVGAIAEVSGDRGPPQRFERDDCRPVPFFDARVDDRPPQYEEQTTYYWTKFARDFALQYLWITPQQWTEGAIKITPGRLQPNVITYGNFNLACMPSPKNACMRNWGHEGAKIHFRANDVTPRLVAHEYGHYAAGYAFGHMDVLAIDGFDPTQCAKRSFQEAIAGIFETIFIHYNYVVGHGSIEAPSVETTAGPITPEDFVAPHFDWNGQCGAGSNADYRMGAPLRQAVWQAIWGTWSVHPVSWESPAQANNAMIDAFAYAMIKNRGNRTEDVAREILVQLKRTQTANIYDEVRAIWRAHRFLTIGDECEENVECVGERTSRCDTIGTPSRCIPDDGAGVLGDYCTSDTHCGSALDRQCQLAAPGGFPQCE